MNITCAKGYIPVNGSQIVCLPDGNWKGLPSKPSCVKLPCSTLDIEHLIQRVENKSTVSFTCEPGFRLIGESQSTCGSRGKWSLPLPECASIDCGPPPAIIHGDVEFQETSVGSKATYTCNTGYHIFDNSTYSTHNSSLEAGQSESMCLDSGTWSPQVMQSTRSVDNSNIYKCSE